MELLEILNKEYPDAECELVHETPFELLISTILSAQCTDKRVNTVTAELFKIADTPEEFCELDQKELERLIHSCGFYHSKAANIKACCRDLVDRFGGQVPKTMEELVSLKGVGRKTANVVLGMAFDVPALAVDTHVFRLSHRLGLSDGKTPAEVERDLMAIFEPKDYKACHLLLIAHGRACCHARAPECENCAVKDLCKEYSMREAAATE